MEIGQLITLWYLKRMIHLAVLARSLKAPDNWNWLYLAFKKYFWLYEAAISLKSTF